MVNLELIPKFQPRATPHLRMSHHEIPVHLHETAISPRKFLLNKNHSRGRLASCRTNAILACCLHDFACTKKRSFSTRYESKIALERSNTAREITLCAGMTRCVCADLRKIQTVNRAHFVLCDAETAHAATSRPRRRIQKSSAMYHCQDEYTIARNAVDEPIAVDKHFPYGLVTKFRHDSANERESAKIPRCFEQLADYGPSIGW